MNDFITLTFYAVGYVLLGCITFCSILFLMDVLLDVVDEVLTGMLDEDD